MGTADEIIGQIPVVVAGGIALKFTNAVFGGQKKSSRRITRSKRKGLSNKYSPW